MCVLKKEEKMSNTHESCVSSQDTYRLVETEDMNSSVSALVSRLHTCSVALSGSSLKNDIPRSRRDDDDSRDEKSMANIFPWLPKINELCRSSAVTKNIKTLENLLTVYLQKVTASVRECYLKPIRAGKLRKCMNEAFFFFHFLYQDIKESVDNTLYLEKMTELMAMYIDMEIKSAKRRKETSKKVVSRMLSALNIFLDRSENHILDAIMKSKYITTNEREICCPILEKLLTTLRTSNMQDTLYVRYLLVFKLWKKIVSDANQRKEINKLAIARLIPPTNFASRYNRFKNVLPQIPNSKNITTFYMLAKINIKTACQNFMKISKDPIQPVIVDKSLFFDSRSQSTFSGKGNAFDGGVSRNLMNEIWSSFSEDNATSNKKTKDNSTAKKKTKKNSPDKDKKKKKKTKSESTDNFSESNSPSDLSGCLSIHDSTSVPDTVTSTVSVEQTSPRDDDFDTVTSADHQPLPDSSTSRTTQDTETTRLPTYLETKLQRDLISTSHSADLKPHHQPSYDCTVTSGIEIQDQKPDLETLMLYTASDTLRNQKTCNGVLITRTDDANVPVNLRENEPSSVLEEPMVTDNIVREIKLEDNQDRCISAVVQRETKPSVPDLCTYSKTQWSNVKPGTLKKKPATKSAVPVITIDDLPDPEVDLKLPLSNEYEYGSQEVQVGDQDLPYVKEEVIEPCYTENDTDCATRDPSDKEGISSSCGVSSSNCDPYESHLVTSSHDDTVSVAVERKPVRIAIKDCIPLNVPRSLMPSRVKAISPNPNAIFPCQSHISSSRPHITSSPHNTAQLLSMAVSSPLVEVSSPQPMVYLQPQVKLPVPQPMVIAPSVSVPHSLIQVPSPQPPMLTPQFKVPPLPPIIASPSKPPPLLPILSFSPEDLQHHGLINRLGSKPQPEFCAPSPHLTVPESFVDRDEFNFSNDTLSLDFEDCFPGEDFFMDYINDGSLDFRHSVIDPNMLERRSLIEDEALPFIEPLISSPVRMDPVDSELSKLDKPVTSRSKHSSRPRNVQVDNKYEAPSLKLIAAKGGMLNNNTSRPSQSPTVIPYHIPVPYAIPNPAGPDKSPFYHCRDCFISIQQEYLLYKYNQSLQAANQYQQSYLSPSLEQGSTQEESDTEENEEIRKMVKEYELKNASESKRAAESNLENSNVNQTDSESKSKLNPHFSLPPKKRRKFVTVETQPGSFPSYPTRPMISIAELEGENIKLPITGIQNNELENAKKREEIIARYKKPVKVPFDQLKPSQPAMQRSVVSQQDKMNIIQPARSYPAPTRATSENVNFAGNSESSGRTFKTPGQLKEHNSFNFRGSPYIGEYGQIVYPQNYNESMSQKESMILKRLSYVEQPKTITTKVNTMDLSVAPDESSKERKRASSNKKKSKEKPKTSTRSSKRTNETVIKKTGTVESSDSKRRRKDASR